MAERKQWWKKYRPTSRRLAQLYSALLYNANLKGFAEGKIYTGNTKAVCVPGLNCYSCPGAVGACPLGALQNALAVSGKRAGWYVLGILMLFGLTLGRTVCGWFCPFGLFQELLYKIPTPKLQKNRITRKLSFLKYLILLIFVVALPLWFGWKHQLPLPGFCKYICPAGTLEGALALLSHPGNAGLKSMLGILFARKLVILLVIVLACVFTFRSFCRFLCPLGAIYGMFSRLSLVGVRVDEDRCNECGACVRSCGMDVTRVGDHECIHCGKCRNVCGGNAISLQVGTFILAGRESSPDTAAPETGETRRKIKRLLRIAAVGSLLAALLWYQFFDPSIGKNEISPTVETEQLSDTGDFSSDAPIGYEVGNQMADFTAECVDGSRFHLLDGRGKVTILNLWATYCTPCIQELPYFSELYREHEGEIAMLAVHSSLVTEDVGEYLADKDWAMPFAVDSADDRIFGITGGSSLLPQTIVLNRRGEVIYNQAGSVTMELLEELYDRAAAESAF